MSFSTSNDGLKLDMKSFDGGLKTENYKFPINISILIFNFNKYS